MGRRRGVKVKASVFILLLQAGCQRDGQNCCSRCIGGRRRLNAAAVAAGQRVPCLEDYLTQLVKVPGAAEAVVAATG